MLAELPEERRQFLLRTCTLGSLTGELCDSLLDTTEGTSIFLFKEGNVVVGRVGVDAATALTGVAAFAIGIAPFGLIAITSVARQLTADDGLLKFGILKILLMSNRMSKLYFSLTVMVLARFPCDQFMPGPLLTLRPMAPCA